MSSTRVFIRALRQRSTFTSTANFIQCRTLITTPPVRRTQNLLRPFQPSARRAYSSEPSTPGSTFSQTSSQPSTPSSSAPESPTDSTAIPPQFQGVPHYQLSFTCKPCTTRSTHRISKQGYHNGTVLISCPSCKARHLIADHLKIFADQSTTLEDILSRKNEAIVRGSVGENQSRGDVGDIEFWRNEAAVKDVGEGDGRALT